MDEQPQKRSLFTSDLGESFAPDMDQDDYERVWTKIQDDTSSAKQPVLAYALVAIALLASACVLWWFWQDAPSSTTPSSVPVAKKLEVNPEPEPVEVGHPTPLVLDDQSEVVSLSATTKVRVIRSEPKLKQLKLEGRARFEVSPSRDRVFEVLASDVTIQVIGTSFVVETKDDGEVHVHVNHGHVRVHHGGESVDLRAGESQSFVPSRAIKPAEVKPPSQLKSKAWVKAAKRGDHKGASRRILKNPELVRDRAEELMLAAEALRRVGKTSEAMHYLDRMLKRFPKDRRAGLAAFTKGRLLLGLRRDYAEAAALFGQVASLRASDALREDALAREVEAWHRVGNYAKARSRALDYLKRYPNGDRTTTVRQFGGVR